MGLSLKAIRLEGISSLTYDTPDIYDDMIRMIHIWYT